MSEKPTLDAFRDSALAGVEKVRQTLRPDEDWLPTMMMDTPDGLMIMPLLDAGGNEYFGQDGIQQVTATIVKAKARMVARVQMGWAATADAHDYRRPADRPDRVEVLIVQVAEPGRQEILMAEVKRGSGPPELGEWTTSPGGGALADALALAVEEAALYDQLGDDWLKS